MSESQRVRRGDRRPEAFKESLDAPLVEAHARVRSPSGERRTPHAARSHDSR